MPKFYPFRAVLPSKDKVALVNSRPFEDYSVAELAAQLDYNPYSFLHVIEPFYKNQQKVDNKKRLLKVNSRYKEFKAEKIIKKEKLPGYYLYKIVTKTNVFVGIVGTLSIEDYKNNCIKKHEDTFDYRVELFKDYMNYAGFYTEPVLVTYPDISDFNQWIEQYTQKKAHFEFATNKKEVHYLWKITNKKDISYIEKTFENLDCVYIADGHHRTESAKRLLDQTSKNPYFMSFLIAESNLKINEFNRLIKDLNGKSKKQFLKLLSKNFEIENKGQTLYAPNQKSSFGMYLDGEFYKLSLKKTNKINTNHILQNLDTQILYDFVLNPILGIEDLRTDQRIEYVSGKQSVVELKNKVDDQEFEVAFLMYRNNIDEIKNIADANLIMPPKSTYIEPKFRVGLTIFEIE
ncbi:MAG: DUF1015 domain-containing protein [Bacteroidota bacterium]|nr:DUF1015 domain-containing protein [Bacteroidota bacterium]